MMAARIHPVLRHVLDDAVAVALRYDVPMVDVAATLFDVLQRLQPAALPGVAPRDAAVREAAPPTRRGERCDEYVSAHVAHQLTDSPTVLSLYTQLMERPGSARTALMAALQAMAIEPAASAAHRWAELTVHRMLTAQAMVHALAAWAELTHREPTCPTH